MKKHNNIKHYPLRSASSRFSFGRITSLRYHNSYFLIAHFHQVLIGGVVFGFFAGLYYWWPKMFGFRLNETIGMTRRVYTYDFDMGWGSLNLISTVGAFLMGIGFLFQVWQIAYSVKCPDRDTTGDAWDGRTLEWSIPSSAPLYNFATLPQVKHTDDWWERKRRLQAGEPAPETTALEPIHMPKNSAIPFVMSTFWFFAGFGFVWEWMWLTIPSMVGVALCMIARSFSYDTDYYIPVAEIERTEAALRGGRI